MAKLDVLEIKLKTDPLNVALLTLYGDLLDNIGDSQKSLNIYEKINAIEHSNFDNLVKLVRCYSRIGNTNQSQIKLHTLQSLTLSSADQFIKVSNLSLEIDYNPDKSIAILNNGLKNFPDNLQLLLEKLNIEKQTGMILEETIDEVLRIDADNESALVAKLQLFLCEGQLTSAQKLLDNIAKKHSKSQFIVLYDNFIRLFSTGIDDKSKIASVLANLTEIPQSELDPEDIAFAHWVIATTAAKIVTTQAVASDLYYLFSRLNDLPDLTKSIQFFIGAALVKWFKATNSQELHSIAESGEWPFNIKEWHHEDEIICVFHGCVGNAFLDNSAWKKAAFHYKISLENDPESEEYKQGLSLALKRQNRQNRFIFIASSIVVLLLLLWLLHPFFKELKVENDLFRIAESSTYPELYLKQYPNGRYKTQIQASIDSLDRMLVTSSMKKTNVNIIVAVGLACLR